MIADFNAFQAELQRLDVRLGGRVVGDIEREPDGRIVFAYRHDATADDFVSLLMPVSRNSFSTPRGLLPCFQMNIPEGFLRRMLTERFGKVLATDDFTLLALTGHDQVGRVSVVPAGFAPDWAKAPHVAIKHLLGASDSSALFSELIGDYGGLGVSGAMPKILVSEKAAMKAPEWIVKFDGEDYPSLSVNERFAMLAAEHSGLPTPPLHLSDDGRILAVRRFDVTDDGHRVGFEDFCSLFALPPEAKYQGSMERMVKVINSFTKGESQIDAIDRLVRSHLLSLAVGNSDAHLKNFGLIYDNTGNVRLSPTFDVLSVRVYPQFRNDIPSLSIGGKKAWDPGKVFQRFATDCGLPPAKVKLMAEAVADGVTKAAHELVAYGKENPRHAPVCGQMIDEWNLGLNRLTALLKERREGIGHSFDAPPPEKKERRTMGRSGMLDRY